MNKKTFFLLANINFFLQSDARLIQIMVTTRRGRKQEPILPTTTQKYSQQVGANLNRTRVAPLAPLSHAQNFDNAQASNTQIRSGFVTQPGELMRLSPSQVGGARRRKDYTERMKGYIARAGKKDPSARTRDSEILRALGYSRNSRLLAPKVDTIEAHKKQMENLRDQRRAASLAQPWGPALAGESHDEQMARQKKTLENRPHGFGKKRKRTASKKKR